MTLKKNTTNTSGESLSETLVAALIISFAMILLFSCAKVGTDIMRKSRESYQEYYDTVNDYEEAQASYVVEFFAKPSTFDMTPHKHDWQKN